MLDFHTPTLEDKEWVDEVLAHSRHRGCVYTFAQLYLWSIHYGTKICRFGDCLLGMNGRTCCCYIYPGGRYDIADVVAALREDAARRGVGFGFCVVEDWQADELDSAFPGVFERHESRDDCDYIYNAQDLITLAGRKYHGKRNHISRFTREHPEWSYEPITAENTAECIEACHIWHDAQHQEDESLETSQGLAAERSIIEKALTERELLGLNGGLIRWDGKVIAFTLGERLNSDTYVIHFEKALPGFEGAYAVINNQFASNELTGYRYIDREEDLGLEGLRKAKLSYYPEILLQKYTLTER